VTDTIAAVEAFIPIRRVRDGRVVEGELFVAWCPETETLAVGEGWQQRRQRFDRLDGYLVVGFEAQLPGRAFRLNRSSHAIEKDPDRVTHYSVLVGETPADDRCDCRGHEAARARGLDCKHTTSVRWLVQEGHL
jgi:hypothetical protein